MSFGVSGRVTYLFVFLLAFSACSTKKHVFSMGEAGAAGEDAGSGGRPAAGGASSEGGTGATSGADAGEGAASSMAGESAGGTQNMSGAGGSGAGGSGSGGSGAEGGMPMVAEPLPNGFACGKNADCENGHCVDSVCCESACADCKACSNALTGQNDGVCAPVLVGQDPHDACADQTATNQCGQDGTCDGEGACAKVAASHVCVKAGCSGDGKSFIPATTCDRDGAGACTTATPQNCNGFPCTAAGCASPCDEQTDCTTGNYCDLGTGKCVARKSDGTSATNGYECTSGIIADGVCCNSACTGQCQSCKQTPGTCKAVTTPRTSCGGSGTCGTKKCDGTSPSCVFPGNEVACPTTCSNDSTAKLASSCNGSGACGAAQSVACSSSQYCTGGVCRSKLGNNTSGCSGAVTCSSGNCSTSQSGGGTMCCASNLQNCSQGCYNLTNDAKHCGSCDGDCGANRKCSSSVCTCTGAKFSCNACASWDFESNTVERWGPSNSGDPTPVLRATPAGAPFSGTRSLAIDVNLAGSSSASLSVPFCPNAGVSTDVSGISMYVYRAGPAYPSNKDTIYTLDSNGSANGLGFGIPAQVNTWVKISGTVSTVNANYLRVNFTPFTDWAGTLYIDQIELTP